MVERTLPQAIEIAATPCPVTVAAAKLADDDGPAGSPAWRRAFHRAFAALKGDAEARVLECRL
jgi:hypothetical protein